MHHQRQTSPRPPAPCPLRALPLIERRHVDLCYTATAMCPPLPPR